MFINVKIDGLAHLRCRSQGLGRGFLLPSISLIASQFLSSPEKLSKHSTNQFFSFLNVGEALYSNAQRSRQLRHELAANPRDVLGAGGTPILPSLTSDTDTFCSQHVHCHFLISLLVSNLTPANRTGYNWRLVIDIVQPLHSTGDFNNQQSN